MRLGKHAFLFVLLPFTLVGISVSPAVTKSLFCLTEAPPILQPFEDTSGKESRDIGSLECYQKAARDLAEADLAAHKRATSQKPTSTRTRRGSPDRPSNAEPALQRQIVINSPMLDAITQNTRGYSEGFPAGVPRTYAWCGGSYKPFVNNAPPRQFTAVTGWGQVYPKAGSPDYYNPEATIEIANSKTYVHLKQVGEWVLVQDQTTNPTDGAHFVADFSAKPAPPMKLETQPDGTVLIGVPLRGFNSHFWLRQRGTYPAGSVDGVYVEMDIRTNDPTVPLVANVGADWWRDASADFVRGFSNNPAAGTSNWVQVTTQWSTLRFYSWSTSHLQANPPPPLASSPLETSLHFTRRFLNASPYCLSAPERQTQ